MAEEIDFENRHFWNVRTYVRKYRHFYRVY